MTTPHKEAEGEIHKILCEDLGMHDCEEVNKIIKSLLPHFRKIRLPEKKKLEEDWSKRETLSQGKEIGWNTAIDAVKKLNHTAGGE